MERLKKIIAILVLICFGSNNISYAFENNTFKLAAPSSFSSFKGEEFKEAAQIQIGIRMALKGLASFDLSSLSALGRRQFAEKTIFTQKISGTMYFDEVQACKLSDQKLYTEVGSYMVKAQTARGEIYYGLISNKKDERGYGVSVIPKRVLAKALEKGVVKFTHESVSRKDRAIIDMYLEHEQSTENNVAIDGWIRERMERGDYSIDNLNPENSIFYTNTLHGSYLKGRYGDFVRHIIDKLKNIGVEPANCANIESALMSKPMVVIPYDKDEELPTITVAGRKIQVKAHSSQFATYVFINRDVFDKAQGILNWDESSGIVYVSIIDEFIHEVGALCGLKVTIKDGKVWNALDEAAGALKRGETVTASEELKNLSPVNLLELELRNDYAAGDVEKKNIFKRAMTGLVMAVVLTGGVYFYHNIKLSEEAAKEQSIQSVNRSGVQSDLLTHQFSENEIAAAISKLKTMDTKNFSKKDIPLLIEILNSSENMRICEWAIQAIGKIGGKEAAEYLIKRGGLRPRFYDDQIYRPVAETEVSRYANSRVLIRNIADETIVVLGNIGQPAVQPLLETLNDPFYSNIRWTVVSALGEMGDKSAVEPLIKLLKDENEKVRESVIEALEKLNDQRAVEPIIKVMMEDKNEKVRCKAVNVLEGLNGARAVEPLIKVISEDHIGPSSYNAAIALGNIGDVRAVEPLIKAVNNKENQEFGFAVLALGQLKDARAVGPLIKVLSHKSWSMRECAAEALGNLKATGAVKPLIETLKDEKKDVRKAAAYALGNIGDKEAIKPLSEALKDEKTDVRKAAAYALGNIGNKEALKPLSEALKDEENRYTGVTEAAAYAISKIGMSNIGDKEAVKSLIEVLKSEHNSIRDSAAKALIDANVLIKVDKSIIDLFVGSLSGKDWIARKYIIVVLGKICDPNTTEVMTSISSNSKEDYDTRAAARMVTHKIRINHGKMHLKDMELRDMINDLVLSLFRKDDFVSELAAETLVKIGQPAVDPLMKMVIKHKNETFITQLNYYTKPSERALKVVSEIDDKVNVQPFTEMLKNESFATRWWAVIMLGRFGGKEETETLIRASRDKNEHVRQAAREAIKKIQKAQRTQNISKIEIDSIVEVLWKASMRSISIIQAREELASLAPEVGNTPEERNRAYGAWIAATCQVMTAITVKRPFKHNPPNDENIRLIASRIKETGIEVFIPKSQFPGDTIAKYRGAVESIGGKLRIYQNIEDLQDMVASPAKSIIMTAGISEGDAALLESLKTNMPQLRFMNFAKMEDLSRMSAGEVDNYQADILSILLVARIITPEDFRDKGSPTYRMLAHLLEDYMPEDVTVENYIQDIVTNADRLIKTILKALPVTAYKVMRQSVEVLWAA